MHRLVAFTGAGISKASGIPTFEELGDLRIKLSREYFNRNPLDFYKILMDMRRLSEKAIPNPAHLILAKYNIPIVTMNIDGLHRKAGSKGVLEVHGNLDYVFCKKCKSRFSFTIVEESIHCCKCNELLRPNVVLYGDNIPLYFNAIDVMGDTDELLVIGTSFYTSTAYDLVDRVKRAGIKITTINNNAEKEVPKLLKKVFTKKINF